MGPDHCVIPDLDVAENRGAAADINTITDDRDRPVSASMGNPKGCTLPDMDVVTDGPCVEDHGPVVPDPDPPTELYVVGEGDPTIPLHPLEEDPVEESAGGPEDFGLDPHPPVAESMEGDRHEPLLKNIPIVGLEIFPDQRPIGEVVGVQVLISLGEGWKVLVGR